MDVRLQQIRNTLALCRAVIVSGDPMDEETRNAINEAIANTKNVDRDLPERASEGKFSEG